MLYIDPDDDPSGEKRDRVLIDPASIGRGLAAMLALAPIQFGNMIAGGDDSSTHNVFMQCCAFGSLPYV